MNVFNLSGPEFLKFYLFLVVFSFIAALILRWMLRGPGGEMSHLLPGLDPFEAAYLAGGPRMVVHTAIAALVHGNALKLKSASQSFSVANPLAGKRHQIERAVYHLVEYGTTSLSELRESATVITAQIRDKLLGANLILSTGQAMMARIAPAVLMLATLAVGIAKIEIGVSRNRPVGYLVFICVVAGAATLLLSLVRVRNTRAGSAVMGRLRDRNAALRTAVGTAPERVGHEDLALAIALFGPAILASNDFTTLRQTLWPPNSSRGGCSSGGGCGGSCGGGSSCGGGGCGGGGCGGGGCGGCGGG